MDRHEWLKQQWAGVQRLYYARDGFDEGEGEERELLLDYYIESEGWEYEGGDDRRIDHDGTCGCEVAQPEPLYEGCEETCGCQHSCWRPWVWEEHWEDGVSGKVVVGWTQYPLPPPLEQTESKPSQGASTLKISNSESRIELSRVNSPRAHRAGAGDRKK